ncbi:MAG TPA: T9SS type A sorting domain-containing protein [Bacteroidia bacterium]|nr:T9SS type A sorting domain-containing protein [Bacteroidia bacterium]
MPLDSAPICNESFYLGDFYTTGYQQGNAVADFKLYGLNGDSLILSQALSGGKPVLLIAGSLTCPVFRAKVATINQVVSTYSAFINVYVIYTLEAHPTDTSVYFGYVNVTSQNTSAGILFPQTQTYGQRKKMVDTTGSYLSISAPVFIDGPCNNWWRNFGPAPNNSYLIGTNGMVLNKQGWFHKSPDNIFCDLDSILNLNSGLCIPPPTIPGSFTLNVLNNIVNGNPGDLLYDYVNIINTTSVTTSIKIKKLQKSLPQGWETAFCADICYGFVDDSIEVNVDPFDTLRFSLDFFTGAVPDSGSVRLGFRNINKPNNSYSMWLKANTVLNSVGLKSPEIPDACFQIYPNPAGNHINFVACERDFIISVYDLRGKEKILLKHENTIDTKEWQNGIYFLTFKSNNEVLTRKIIISR